MTSIPPPLPLLAHVAAALPNGSVNVFDKDLRYVFAAGPGLAAVGLEAEALIGRTVRDVFGPAASAVEEPYARALAGEQVTFDLRVFQRTYSLSAAPLATEDGVVRSIVVLAQDVTAERDELQRRDEQRVIAEGATRDREAFVATIAHELRQPLAPLRVALELLNRTAEPEQRDRLAGIIERQVEQIDRLILDLSTAAALPTLTLDLGTLDVAAVLDDAVQQFAAVAASQQRRLIWERRGPLPVNGDEVRLRQVFSNLLHNAVKFTDPDGSIQVTASADEVSAILRICDDGRGIAPDLLPRIFDLFVHEATERGGTGIGLNVVRRVTELHGGAVEARSDGAGCGSEFVVRLPLTAETPSA